MTVWQKNKTSEIVGIEVKFFLSVSLDLLCFLAVQQLEHSTDLGDSDSGRCPHPRRMREKTR